MARSKEDWEKYFGLTGIDIYNFLHPAPPQPIIGTSSIETAPIYPANVLVIKNTLAQVASGKIHKDPKSLITWLEFERFNFIDAREYQSILIRDCYDELLFHAKIWSSDGTMNSGRFLTVGGTPGIGKSLWLLYLAFLFNQLGCIVVYHHWSCPASCFVIIDGQVTINGKTNADANGRKTVYLYDTVPAIAIGDVVILVASPRQLNRVNNEFKKSLNHQSMFMPIWSLYELGRLSEICYKLPLSDRSKDGYDYLGGIPRRIFSTTWNSAKEELQELISHVHNPRQLLLFSGEMWTSLPETFHDLIHVIPSDDYRKFRYQPASPHVSYLLTLLCKGD